jgi:hypothetical protein
MSTPLVHSFKMQGAPMAQTLPSLELKQNEVPPTPNPNPPVKFAG